MEILEKQDKNYSYLHLIKTPKIRKLTLLTGIVWWVSPPKNTYKDIKRHLNCPCWFQWYKVHFKYFNDLLFLMLCRYGVASTYYGISLNISGFGLNMYLTHFIYAAVEVPGKLMVYCLLNIIGRRSCLAGTLLLTGICIAINIFVPKGCKGTSFFMSQNLLKETQPSHICAIKTITKHHMFYYVVPNPQAVDLHHTRKL